MDTVDIAPPDLTLGTEGFSFPDLFRPERLRDLYNRFTSEVEAADPAFWGRIGCLSTHARRTAHAGPTLLAPRADYVR